MGSIASANSHKALTGICSLGSLQGVKCQKIKVRWSEGVAELQAVSKFFLKYRAWFLLGKPDMFSHPQNEKDLITMPFTNLSPDFLLPVLPC